MHGRSLLCSSRSYTETVGMEVQVQRMETEGFCFCLCFSPNNAKLLFPYPPTPPLHLHVPYPCTYVAQTHSTEEESLSKRKAPQPCALLHLYVCFCNLATEKKSPLKTVDANGKRDRCTRQGLLVPTPCSLLQQILKEVLPLPARCWRRRWRCAAASWVTPEPPLRLFALLQLACFHLFSRLGHTLRLRPVHHDLAGTLPFHAKWFVVEAQCCFERVFVGHINVGTALLVLGMN